MKNLFLAVFVLIGLNLAAQEKLTEGILIFNQTMSSDDEQVNSQLRAMGLSTSTTYFKGNKSRNETRGDMTGEMSIVMDGTSNQMLMIMNQPMMGKKYALRSMTPSEEDLKNITVTKGDENRTFLGYDCEQYFVTVLQNDQKMEMELFTTDKITAISQDTNTMGDKVNGFPLYLKLEMSQMGTVLKVVTEISEIKKVAVPDEKFSLTPPEGYEKMEGM